MPTYYELICIFEMCTDHVHTKVFTVVSMVHGPYYIMNDIILHITVSTVWIDKLQEIAFT